MFNISNIGSMERSSGSQDKLSPLRNIYLKIRPQLIWPRSAVIHMKIFSKKHVLLFTKLWKIFRLWSMYIKNLAKKWWADTKNFFLTSWNRFWWIFLQKFYECHPLFYWRLHSTSSVTKLTDVLTDVITDVLTDV